MAGTDAIILLVVVFVMIYAVKGTIKHFKGEGACCGGGSGSVPPRRLQARGNSHPGGGEEACGPHHRPEGDAHFRYALQ